jgi:hypothetical protein
MISAIQYLRAKREFNLTRDQDFLFRMAIVSEGGLEFAIVISIIVIAMGLN